jgi:hypothetical protein
MDDPEINDADTDEDTVDRESERLAEVHAKAMRRFEAIATPQQEIRQHALTCRRFISIPGAQWDGEWGAQFVNAPRMEIDKLSKGVDKIVNDYRQNRIVPDFRPSGGNSDQETATSLDGIHRADAYKFKSQQALDNAFEEAAAGGFGAWRLTNVLEDETDKDNDAQRINPGMLIADADQRVYFDGNSKQYDKSDAKFCFVLTADARENFEAEWPDKTTSWPGGINRLTLDWFTPDVILKCEYYEVEEVKNDLLIMTHKASKEERREWATEVDADEQSTLRKQGWEIVKKRRTRQRVHKYLMSGAEVLEDQGFIAGSMIPVIPVYGKRWFVDNQERFRGYVSKRMDSQRLYNGKVSKLAEQDSVSGREIPIFAAEQMPPNLAAQWARQNIDRHPYALVNPLRNPDGSIASAGPIGKVEPPQVAPVTAALLQIASSDLTEDMEDPDKVMANVSADAMDIAATRVDAKSGIYLDNMRQSVQRAGEVWLDMAGDVYCEKLRKVETMSEDGDDGEATLHQPKVDKDGNFHIINDFTKGRYKVIADVTEATTTRREKTVRASLHIATVAQAAQDMELSQIATLIAVMNTEGEGMNDFQKYARAKLVGMKVVEPTEDEKKQMEQAQQEQGQQPPDPAALLEQAKAMDVHASAQLKMAKLPLEAAKTKLAEAQANALDGDGAAEVPDTPTGLHDADGNPPLNPLQQAHLASQIQLNHAKAMKVHTEAQHLPLQRMMDAHGLETDRLKATRPPASGMN